MAWANKCLVVASITLWLLQELHYIMEKRWENKMSKWDSDQESNSNKDDRESKGAKSNIQCDDLGKSASCESAA